MFCFFNLFPMWVSFMYVENRNHLAMKMSMVW